MIQPEELGPEQKAECEAYLEENDYSSLYEWMIDSDYKLTTEGWKNEDGHLVGDPWVCLWWALDAAKAEFDGS